MNNGKEKQVLIIAPQPFFTNRGTPINVRALATVLGQANYNVDLLVFSMGEDITLAGVEIIRSPNPFGIQTVPPGPSWRKLILDILMFGRALRQCLRRSYDVIHGIEEGGMMAWLLTRFTNARLIYDVDSDILQQLEQKHFLDNRLFLGLVRSVEKRCLTDARAVITVCPELTARVRSAVPQCTVYEVLDFPLESAEEPDEASIQLAQEAVRSNGLAGRRLILYTGNFQDYQGLDLLVQAFGRLKKDPGHGDAALLVVGGSSAEERERKQLQELIARLELGNDVALAGLFPLESMGAFIGLADVLASPRKEGVNTPLKIYTYMASGKPIVATDIASHTQVLDQTVAYLGAPNEDEFARALAQALDDSPAALEQRQAMCARARALADSRFSREQFRANVLGIYYSITGDSVPAAKPAVTAAIAETGLTDTGLANEVLVTGAGGFVGSRLVQTLLEQGKGVRAMVRNDEQAQAMRQLGAEPIIVDITEPESLCEAFRGIKQVYHIAALFRKAGLPDETFHEVNVEGTRNVFEAAIANGAHSIIHCSTVGVHGDVENPPGDENAPFNPGDIYQETKLAGEQTARSYFDRGAIRGAIIRPAMIYGPGDMRTLKMFRAVARRRFFYVGAGRSLVHFVDVRDLAKGMILAMNAAQRGDIQPGSTYILAGRKSCELRELTGLIAANFSVKPPRLRLPVKPMQMLGVACETICRPLGVQPPIFKRRVDFFTKNRSFIWSKAERELGYYPERSLEEEVADICQWYVENNFIRRPHNPSCRVGRATSSTIVRELDGSIKFWDAGAESKYGWTSDQARGVVSHDLLQTQFPVELERINDQIRRTKLWEGELVHTTRTGEKICVFSRWECVSDDDTGNVLSIVERNTPITSGRPELRKIPMLAGFTFISPFGYGFIELLPMLHF